MCLFHKALFSPVEFADRRPFCCNKASIAHSETLLLSRFFQFYGKIGLICRQIGLILSLAAKSAQKTRTSCPRFSTVFEIVFRGFSAALNDGHGDRKHGARLRPIAADAEEIALLTSACAVESRFFPAAKKAGGQADA